MQYSVSFSFAQYEYESPFFPLSPDFPKISWERSENQQDRLSIGYVYVEVNQQFPCFASVKFLSLSAFHSRLRFQA